LYSPVDRVNEKSNDNDINILCNRSIDSARRVKNKTRRAQTESR